MAGLWAQPVFVFCKARLGACHLAKVTAGKNVLVRSRTRSRLRTKSGPFNAGEARESKITLMAVEEFCS